MKTFLTLSCAVAAASATVIWDGRVPSGFTLSDFDSSSTSMYNTQYNLGQGQTWSEVLEFPEATTSLFDNSSTKAYEVTIDDQSIFQGTQTGFRRSELMPSVSSGSDSTVQGITTLHFSMQPDTSKPLNYSHEYQLVFIETQDYSSHVWTIETGVPYGGSISNPETLRLTSSTANGASENVLFSAPFTGWSNWAVQVDWDSSTLTAYYSTGTDPLELVVNKVENNAVGKGQEHIGVLKMPTGASGSVTTSGYQESGIHEGVVYGGVFIESGSSVTLS